METAKVTSDLVKTDVVKNIKDDILNSLGEASDSIRYECFEPIWSSLNADINKEKLVEDFQIQIKNLLLYDFNKMWSANNVDSSLMMLEELKNKFAADNKPKWRATNQPVELQLKPYVLHHEKKTKKMLKELIFDKKQEIKKSVEVIELNRKQFKHIEGIRNDAVWEPLKEQIIVFEKALEQIGDIEAGIMKIGL